MSQPPSALEQSRQQVEQVRDRLVQERQLVGQLRNHGLEHLVSLLAARLNMLIMMPCTQCRPDLCAGGPALCALALAEKIDRDTRAEEELRVAHEKLTSTSGQDQLPPSHVELRATNDKAAMTLVNELRYITRESTAVNVDRLRRLLCDYDSAIKRATADVIERLDEREETG
jgi:hypothetical protein